MSENDLKSVERHQKEFDRLYSSLKEDGRSIGFPLREIEKFHWGRGPYGDPIYSYFYRRFTVFLLGLLRVEGSQRILNIGCGLGFDEKNLAHLHTNLEIWSIDISREMISKAIENQCPSRLCLSLAEALPFPNGSFDRILAREVIEHALSPKSMMSEIGRCLKPGGLAVLTTEFHSSLSPPHLYSKFFYQRWAVLLQQRLPKAPYQNKPPLLTEIKEWLKSSGLLLENAIWDGALYQLCTSLLFQKIFKSKAVAVARFFSHLENSGSMERFFCDQVKFVLRKPLSTKESMCDLTSIGYRCPVCHGTFEDFSHGKQCRSCGRIYPYTNEGIPNFIVFDLIFAEATDGYEGKVKEQRNSGKRPSEKVKRGIFESVHYLAYWTYLFLVLLVATVWVFWRVLFRKSELRAALNLDEKLSRYLQIGDKGFS